MNMRENRKWFICIQKYWICNSSLLSYQNKNDYLNYDLNIEFAIPHSFITNIKMIIQNMI